MSASSKIEWTDKTWNPVTGCTKYSTGCVHCYAETMARRLKAMGVKKYANGFDLTLHENSLKEPFGWKKPHTIFVCSMADLFHNSVSFDFIDQVMDTIRETKQHRYQILTKRAARMAKYFSTREIPRNVWLGVTVEAPSEISRIDHLRGLSASIRFLSCEPLIEDLGELNLKGIDWVTVSPKSTGVSTSEANELKLVYDGDEEFVDFCHRAFIADHYYLQPMSMQNTDEVIEYIKHNPQWKLSIQTHKLLKIQ